MTGLEPGDHLLVGRLLRRITPEGEADRGAVLGLQRPPANHHPGQGRDQDQRRQQADTIYPTETGLEPTQHLDSSWFTGNHTSDPAARNGAA